MTTIALETTDWYMRLLEPLSREIKLNIINRLSTSLLMKTQQKKVDMSFFDGLSNAWEDEKSPEEEMRTIRMSRTSGMTRSIVNF